MAHTCPRRREGGPLSDGENQDEYRDGHGLVNSFAPGCTYCGSISGDDFMAYVRGGGEVGGTDKNYKAYLEKDSGRPYESEEYTFEGRDGQVLHGTQTVQGTGIMHAKFYYQHLSEEQMREFVQLLNEGKVNHSIYVLPYFIVKSGAPGPIRTDDAGR